MNLYPPINYIGQIFRPPSEAKSLLIQVTVGCSHNRCTYCMMYREKEFFVRPLEDIKRDLEIAQQFYGAKNIKIKRIFFCDGDALAAPFELLQEVLQYANHLFPSLERVGTYVTAQNILDKTLEELKVLAELGMTIGYLGLESGADSILKLVVKGNSAQDMITAGMKLQQAGWRLSVIAMLGLGGRELSHEHIFHTSQVVSQLSPHFFSFLTTMSLPGSPYEKMVQIEKITMLTTKELLQEMHEIIVGIVASKTVVLRINHVSNMFPVAGELPRDQKSICNQILQWIEQEPEGKFPAMPMSY